MPRDVLAGIWVQVLITRIRTRARTGKTPSVREACREIAANGGIISAVGGNQDALVAANTAGKKNRWQRFQVDASSGRFSPNAAGSIFVSHTISNAGTLHARYSEAIKLIADDPRVRLIWLNLARQMLGLAPKRWVSRFIGRRSHGA